MTLHTILGANEVAGTGLLSVLEQFHEEVRTICSFPLRSPGSQHRVVDFLNYEEVVTAIAGSTYVYLLLNPAYCAKTWEEEWLPVMRHCINACKETCAKLIFLDNTYMYGKTEGIITEQTPYQPVGRKGRVRATVATLLQNEMQEGRIRAVIGRAAKMYGPGVEERNSEGFSVFERLIQGKRPKLLANPDIPRSLSYLPDITQALYILATHEEATGKLWHLPTARPALTGRNFAAMAADCMEVASPEIRTWIDWEFGIARLFNAATRELSEIKNMEQGAFLFDSSAFELYFRFLPTPYQEGIKATADWYKKRYT